MSVYSRPSPGLAPHSRPTVPTVPSRIQQVHSIGGGSPPKSPIEKLVDNLKNGNNTEKASAADSLRELALKNNRTKIGEIQGVFEALVALLKSGSTEVSNNAADSLRELALNKNNQIKIGEIQGVFEALVALLRSENPKGQQNAAGALQNIALNKKTKLQSEQQKMPSQPWSLF